MELREFLIPFRKSWRLLIFISLVFGIIAYIVSGYLPVRYQALVTVYIQKVPDNKAGGEYFAYEGYYAQKSAQEYTDSVLGFLESPELTLRAIELVGGSVAKEDPSALQKSMRATKIAPQLVKLTVTLGSAEKAKELVSGLTRAIEERTQLVNQSFRGKMKVDLLTTEPLVKTLVVHRLLNTVIAAGAGSILACIWIWLREYLKGS